MSEELTQKEMISIVEQNIKQVCGQIYNGVISKRVADKTDDKKSAEAAVENLKKLEKVKDEFEIILKELKEIKDGSN